MSDTTAVAKLPHNKYASDIREYLKAKADKQAADKASRQAAEKVKNLEAVLFIALGGARAGKCGNATIVVEPGNTIPGALTLKDGRKVPLSDILELTIRDGNAISALNPDTVKTWYGGAQGSDKLNVIVAGDSV